MWTAVLLSACSTPTPAPTPSTGTEAAASAAPAEEASRTAEPRPARNLPPTIDAIDFTPPVPKATDTILVTVTTHDAEKDPIDLDFEWFVNDAPIVDVASERLTGRFKKGDKVRVRVAADDGTSTVVDEPEAIVIANSAPVFETGRKDIQKVDGFAFRATDPDGDPLTWRLEDAPAGMSISSTGVLAYQGSQDEKAGAYTVAVIVEDGEAWGRFEFPLTVTGGSKAGGLPAAAR